MMTPRLARAPPRARREKARSAVHLRWNRIRWVLGGGSAPDLGSVVEFHDARFGIHHTAEEKAELVAFLRTL
jgi:hypothetical protein